MRFGRLAVSAVLSFGLLSFQPAQARPGTPDAVDLSDGCNGWVGLGPASLQRPALCLMFRNRATEEVLFDVDFRTGGIEGTAGPPPGSRLGCLTPGEGMAPGVTYLCTARYNLLGWNDTTRADPSDFGRGLAVAGRLRGSDSEWQGFYLAELEFDTEYCVRVRARDTSDTVSEKWSTWDCARTRPAPPKPEAPRLTVDYNPLRGTLSAAWSAGERIGFYTIEGRASLEQYSSEVARLIPRDALPSHEAAQGEIPQRRYTATNAEMSVPFGLAKAMDGEAYLFKVCAYNYAGRACSPWVSSLGEEPPRSVRMASVRDAPPVAGSRPPSAQSVMKHHAQAREVKPASKLKEVP